MRVKKPKILAEYALVTRDREDIRTFAKQLAGSLNPNFFVNFVHPEDIIHIALNGTQEGGKSTIVDEMAYAIFQDDDIGPLTGLEVPVSEYAPLYGNQELTLSWREQTPESIYERQRNPGIHFDENVPLHKVEPPPWISIDVRMAKPPFKDGSSDAMDDIEADLKITLREQERAENKNLPTLAGIQEEVRNMREQLKGFAYVSGTHFRHKPGVRKAFKDAVKAASDEQPSSMPRLIVIRIHDQRLIDDPVFQPFMNMMERIQDSPSRGPEILADSNDLG